ncbi:MAG: DnaB-like helicase C-terminal domain-containing protein [Fusobacteriaceae bacterium]
MKEIISKLGKHKQAPGGNLKFEVCPFCGKDKGKFYLQKDTGKFICHSASCGEKGGLKKLAEKLGITTEIKSEQQKKVDSHKMVLNENDFTVLKRSSGEINSASLDLIEYWEDRGISLDTLISMSVFKHKFKGTAFFYREEGGKVVTVKYRSCDDKKIITQEAGGKVILWNYPNATSESIIITEGEPDALSLAECGYFNRVVSVPFGVANFDWIENNQDFLDSKKEIILALDNDVAGKECIRKLSLKLDVSKLKTVNLGEYKDINEILIFEGKEFLKNIIDNPLDLEIEGIKDISEIGRFDINNMTRFTTGIKSFDVITRGIKESELSVFAGDNSSGKTTLVKQLMLSAVQQDKKVWVFNGEITAEIFKEDLYLQANGMGNLERFEDLKVKGEFDWKVNRENYEKIDKWLSKNIKVFSSDERATEENIKNKMVLAATKMNCFLFVIDNLSVITFKGDQQPHQMQGEFTVWCKEFAKRYGVAVVLVNHMTKSTDGMKKNKNHIKGSGIITDIADMVVGVHRMYGDDFEHDAELEIMKNRLHGKVGTVQCGFNTKTKRIYDFNNESLENNRQYNWIKKEVDEFGIPSWE